MRITKNAANKRPRPPRPYVKNPLCVPVLQNRLACGASLVRTADRRIVRCSLENHRILGSLCGNLPHHLDERIDGLLGLRLRRLDHYGLMEEQREVDGRCVEAEVEKPLGNIESSGSRNVIVRSVIDESVKHEFVLAD